MGIGLCICMSICFVSKLLCLAFCGKYIPVMFLELLCTSCYNETKWNTNVYNTHELEIDMKIC